VFLDWTTTIQANVVGGMPVAGATVSIKDKDNLVVYAGTTDASGRVVAVLKQYKIQGATKTLYNDYTVVVSSGGNSLQQTFTANKKQTLTLQLGASQQSAIQTSKESLAGLSLEAIIAERFAPFQATKVPEEVKLEPVLVKLQAPSLGNVFTANTVASVPQPIVSDDVANDDDTELVDEAFATLSAALARRGFDLGEAFNR
jgi:hypothetical protein